MKGHLAAAMAGLSFGMLGGCAALILPQNPDEFRAGVMESPSLSYTERHHVKRPYHLVANEIAKKARECLNGSFRRKYIVYNGPYRYWVQDTAKYKSTIQATGRKLVLAVQYTTIPKQISSIQKEPPDGKYLIVVDTYPRGDGTQIDIYSIEKLLNQAIKHWAAGTNMGCPDLSSSS